MSPRTIVEEVDAPPRQRRKSVAPSSVGRIAIVVAQRIGGQGKTVTAQLLHLGLIRSGRIPTVVSVDASTVGGASKLKRCVPEAIDVVVAGGESLDGAESAFVGYDAVIGSLLTNRDVVVDLGANVIDALLAHARERALRKYQAVGPLRLVTPVVADAASLREAEALFEITFGDSNLRFARRAAVVNWVHGDPRRLGTAWSNFASYCDKRGIALVDLPRANLAFNDAHGISFVRMFSMTQAEYVAAADPPHYGVVSGRLIDFEKWARAAISGLTAAGIAPAMTGPGWERVERHFDPSWMGPRDPRRDGPDPVARSVRKARWL